MTRICSRFVSLLGTESSAAPQTFTSLLTGLGESVQDLKGFPQNPSDKRNLRFGEFGPQFAGGAATMDFTVRIPLATLWWKCE
jgi:hypothetical protein